ncbi:pentapeptide repeat-containing protein [Nostoc sp.]|uniref:pentapeptide repeat-containing protein n=1 Tax=Nostoc sp. TaxID=1180 RepID=UPI002FFB7271
MNQPLSPEEPDEIFQAIDNEVTEKLSELTENAGLSLAKGYIGADLSSKNFSGDNLSNANLSNTNLSKSNLSGADLSGAFLYHAD